MEKEYIASLIEKGQVYEITSVSGGDIASAFRLKTEEGVYFMKINPAHGMSVAEAAGLNTLQEAGGLRIPQVYRALEGKESILLLEWIGQGPPSNDYWKKVGSGLAIMHNTQGLEFGFYDDNYIGPIVQKNDHHEEWATFYAEQRLIPLARQCFDQEKLTQLDLDQLDRLCSRLNDHFPKEDPSLVHGDLWSANLICDDKGAPVLIDPAVYYGHREMDLGMTALFGRFPEPFYDAYHEQYPLEKGWRERMPLTQLWPLMVHLFLFGGGYRSSVKSILKQYGS